MISAMPQSHCAFDWFNGYHSTALDEGGGGLRCFGAQLSESKQNWLPLPSFTLYVYNHLYTMVGLDTIPDFLSSKFWTTYNFLYPNLVTQLAQPCTTYPHIFLILVISSVRKLWQLDAGVAVWSHTWEVDEFDPPVTEFNHPVERFVLAINENNHILGSCLQWRQGQ